MRANAQFNNKPFATRWISFLFDSFMSTIVRLFDSPPFGLRTPPPCQIIEMCTGIFINSTLVVPVLSDVVPKTHTHSYGPRPFGFSISECGRAHGRSTIIGIINVSEVDGSHGQKCGPMRNAGSISPHKWRGQTATTTPLRRFIFTNLFVLFSSCMFLSRRCVCLRVRHSIGDHELWCRLCVWLTSADIWRYYERRMDGMEAEQQATNPNTEWRTMRRAFFMCFFFCFYVLNPTICLF